MRAVFRFIAKRKRTLIYMLVTVSVAGLAFYQYRHSQQAGEQEARSKKILPSLELSQVQQVSIWKGEKKKIRFFRQGKGWFLAVPVQDTADADLVEDWVENLLSKKVQTLQSTGADWAEYGLDQDINTITVTTVSKQRWELNISHYSAFDGSFYIKRGEELLLGDVSWAKLTDREGDYFRSYKMVNIKEHPVSLEYKSHNFQVGLNWENYKWKRAQGAIPLSTEKRDVKPVDKKKISKPKLEKDKKFYFPLSQSALESYWSSLSNVNFEKKTYPDTKSFRQRFKLDAPIMELNIGFKEGRTWSLKVGPEVKGEFYALVSGRDYIFSLDKEQKEQVFLTEKQIRDHRAPFEFDKNQVYFIDLKGYGLDLKLKREKRTWVLADFAQKKKVLTNKTVKGESPGREEKPAGEREKLVVEKGKLVSGKEESAVEKKKSAGEREKSVVEKGKPVSGKAQPAVEKEKPGIENGKLATKNGKPVSERSMDQELNANEVKNVLNRIGVLSAVGYFDRNREFSKTAQVVLKDKDAREILRLELSSPFEAPKLAKASAVKKSGKKLDDKASAVNQSGKTLDDKAKKKMVYVLSSKGRDLMTLDFDSLQFVFSPSLLHSPVSDK